MLSASRYAGNVATKLVDSDTRACIERALGALGREEPDDWGESTMAHLASRDPEPARTARREVVEAAERLRHHPVLGVAHCGHFVAFLALAHLSMGVLVIPGTRRKPVEDRQGGVEDLYVTDAPDEPEALFPHLERVFASGTIRPTYQEIPLFAGLPKIRDVWDILKRLSFHCEHCGLDRPVKNINLLRSFFEAVVRGDDRVWVFPDHWG